MKKIHLTPQQRYTIAAMLQQGCTQKIIAQTIGKHKSVVSREIARNSNSHGKYSFACANQIAQIRKERMTAPRKLKQPLYQTIIGYIRQDWSPQQIEGYLKTRNQEHVSHETIYRIVRRDKAQGGDLYRHMRHKLKHRKRPVGKSIPIKNRVSIDQRPSVVDARTRFGDWEMDTIIGKNGRGAILTLVERQTAFCLIEKLPYGKNAKKLSKSLVAKLLPYKNCVHTITTDNGTEFADHQNFAKKLNTSVFFAHPYSSWEKGLIENTNKLIRQYIPKNANFDDFNYQQIKEIQHKINNRPRKKLKFNSPKQNFFLNLQTKVACSC